MDDIGVVEVVQSFANLVDDILFMLLLEDVSPDEGVQVHVHVLEDEIDVDIIGGPQNFLQPDNIRVFQLLQKHDFAIDALGVCGVGESIEIFFQSLQAFSFSVLNFPDVPVCPAAYFLEQLILNCDMGIHCLAH